MYQPNWSSLDTRPVPAWFGQAKFGIFIHWGLYAVPAWAPKGHYSEWYAFRLAAGAEKEPAAVKFHQDTYGAKFRYEDFVAGFNAELFNADDWADLFVRCGAKYVVPTSKHHDGFCLWPSPQSWNWNSVDVGPHRDLMGELTQAVRARNLKMGVYYSLYEWFRPIYLENPERYAVEHMIPQMKDLVTRYQPAVLFTDGEWEHPSATFHSCEFLAWLFNESVVRDEIVVNDRWGNDTRSVHGGYFTTEYGEVGFGKTFNEGKVWEECRGIGKSFGYSRVETLSDYLSTQALIHMLIDIVSKGGNLLLNIGPTADGLIPVIMEERLLGIGDWLAVNGEAIYETQKWRATSEGETVRYTAKGDAVYAIVLKWPGRTLTLRTPHARGTLGVQILGQNQPLAAAFVDGVLTITLPEYDPESMTSSHGFALKLTGVH
jgi:alpha-L-fucosidase